AQRRRRAARHGADADAGAGHRARWRVPGRRLSRQGGRDHGPAARRTGRSAMIRVLIVDDHDVVRQGLRFVLDQEEDIEVAGECADGARAIARLGSLRPDVMLLDMVMPGTGGLDVLKAISDGSAGWRPAVIVLTSFQEDERVIEAVRAGALSYLPDTAAVDRGGAAGRAARRGGRVPRAGTAAPLQGPGRRASPR